MIFIKYKELFIKFIFCSIVLIILFLILSKLFYKKPVDIKTNVVTSKIEYTDDNTVVNVEYPRFDNDRINKTITDYLYSYVRDFRNNKKNKSLNIKYDLVYIDDYVNVQYNIDNSLDDIMYYNMLFDLKKSEISYITSIYDENYLKKEIYNEINNKFSSDISELIAKDTLNNYTYIIKDKSLDIYFNNIDNKPFISLSYLVNNYNNDNSLQQHKYIIFTYDDGPSEYTAELLSILNKYNSSATFFMLGDKMKNYSNTVLDVYNSNSEVGSHGYSLKDLSNATSEDIDTEISVTNALFYEITRDKLLLYRPAYNKYNDYMNELELELVNYDIDTKDWLVKDSKIIYDNVINNACNECIVLMHDKYKKTLQATEKLIPELNRLGYEVISYSNFKNIAK